MSEEAAPEVTPDAGGTEAAETTPEVTPEGAGTEAQPDLLDLAEYGSRKVKVKVDGEESELTVEELVKNHQLEKASRQRFNDADKRRREAEKAMQEAQQTQEDFKVLLDLMQSGPQGFAQAAQYLGVNPAELRAAMAKEHADYEALTPDQKRQLELDQREKALAEREKRDQEAQRQAQHQQQVAAYKEQIQATFTGALAESGRSADPDVMAEMYGIAGALSEEGMTLTPDLVTKVAQRAIQVVDERRTSFLGAEDAWDRLPEAAQKKFTDIVRKKLAEASKDPHGERVGTKSEMRRREIQKPRERRSMDDVIRELSADLEVDHIPNY